MKESVVVSVSSIHGTKQIHLDKGYRQFLKVFGYSILVGLVVIACVIYYLNSEVDSAKQRQQQLETHSMTLNEELDSLKRLRVNLENDIHDREERIGMVSDRLGDLEKVLGINEGNGVLESRLDAAAISSSVRMVMLAHIPNGAPVINARISSGYGKRTHPVDGKVKMHRGQDFAVNTGTPVYSPADAVVEVARRSKKGSGNFLKIQHSYGFSTSYSHLKGFNVKAGEFIKKGDLIAYSGNSGLSSGPHLHYEIRFLGRSLDPKPFIDWGVNNFAGIFNQVRGIRWESLVNRVELRVSSQLQLSSQKVVRSKENSS
ncbi:M23 family metallopeptidase [Vibrio profundum]|uniref:peptidoglycan DD-metalloendopeptidase family protein n=1 Tax=Vibrio profundum TaxID=2910247 RepID=UPI003D10D4BA